MARRVSLLGLVGLVDPHADDLAGRAEGDVQSDGEPGARGGLEVRGEPAQERGDAGEGAAGGDDEAAVTVLVGAS